tara:strand:+ start:306 stop:662 length:357 start_codon:yes stop_codon:yes gene_type:complete
MVLLVGIKDQSQEYTSAQLLEGLKQLGMSWRHWRYLEGDLSGCVDVVYLPKIETLVIPGYRDTFPRYLPEIIKQIQSVFPQFQPLYMGIAKSQTITDDMEFKMPDRSQHNEIEKLIQE